MKTGIIVFMLVIFLASVLYYYKKPSNFYFNLPNKNIMKITNDAFGNNEYIPKKYTCDGEDINPFLKIEDVPNGAKSLVLIVDDPDAPMGNWNHWLVWNIDPSVSEINENSIPKGGIEGMNDFKRNRYGGPCPPSGIHHYHFKIYALDTKLELSPEAKKKEVEKAMNNHILDWSEIAGLYER